jgi:arylsulfatase A-like enzyme/sugar lactone lactonase YvrE
MKNILTPFLLFIMTSTAVAAPKNIVLILADDLGWADTTLYGKTSLYETPNIERLAARGMTFSSAYAAPICSPTRGSIMTGQNPARHGMTAPSGSLPDVRFDPIANTSGPPHQKSANVKSATRLDPAIPTLAQLLKDAGYATAHFGKWHLGREPHSPLELGFDADIPHWHGPGPKTSYLAPWGYENPNFKEGKPGEHIEDRMAREAVEWLKQRDRKKPFFMNYWQFSVHAPFGAKPELIDRYRKKIKRGAKQQSPTYAAMVHSLDDAVGSLLDTLDAEGILDETVIVFYSDNGGNIHCGLEETDASGEKYITAITSNHPLRGGKGGIHEGGVRVPAVVVWPGATKPGSRSDVRIQSNDLYPTILRMLNVERPQDHVIDGVDFAKALRGEDMDRGPMFTHVPGHGKTPQWLPPSTSVHDGDWKMIRTYHYGEDGEHQYRLYNLREDIGENNNLASSRPEKVKVMDRLIEDYIVEANVVVPLPNSKFDPAKFDPSTIGVQAGGLKMPPAFKGNPKRERGTKPMATVNKASMLGWIAKNAEATVEGDSLRLSPNGRQAFIANAKVRANGPAEVRMRIRTQTDGKARLQWRTEGQELFPKNGQTKSFPVTGGDWQELKVSLPVEGRLVHVRLFLPNGKKPIEIDWIEVGSKNKDAKDRKRWDFGATAEPKRSAKLKREADKAETWQIKRLAGDLKTAEGPVWDSTGKLYFTEIFANQVHEYTPETGALRSIRRDSGGANGMALDSRGRLVMCEMLGKRVVRRELDGTIVPLWQADHPGKGGPNDVVISSTGNIYFTMPRHKCVYRISHSGKVEAFVSDIAGINGVMLSGDETTLFATSYKERKVHAFPIDESKGVVGTGRLFAQIHTEGTEHGADGMTIDDRDRLYVACLGGVWIFDSQGRQVGMIPLPGEKVTNCAFAGDGFKTLYITTQQGLFRAVRKVSTAAQSACARTRTTSDNRQFAKETGNTCVLQPARQHQVHRRTLQPEARHRGKREPRVVQSRKVESAERSARRMGTGNEVSQESGARFVGVHAHHRGLADRRHPRDHLSHARRRPAQEHEHRLHPPHPFALRLQCFAACTQPTADKEVDAALLRLHRPDSAWFDFVPNRMRFIERKKKLVAGVGFEPTTFRL